MNNLKFKIIISVYICLFVLAFYNAFNSYHNNISQAKQTIFAKLSTLSKTLASQIDGDNHERIINKFKNKDAINVVSQDEDYFKIHQLLKQFKSSSSLNSPIYTLFPSNNHQKFYFGVTSSQQPYFRHQYETPPKELIDNFTKGGYIDEYKDENGTWLSSFTPIKNKAGKVVAIVQADQNFEEFMIDVNHKLIGNISFIILIYSVFGFLLYLFLKQVLEREEVYTSDQSKHKEELEIQVNKRTQELNISNKKLHSVNKELESFFYSTSHDIRGPLCRILGLSFLAKIEDDKQELVEMIEIESQKMDNMLKKMISVNNLRIKTLKIENVLVSDMVNNVLFKTKKKYDASKAEVIIKTETQSLNKFNSDKEIIESIVFNLLDNAFKFSEFGNPKIEVNSFVDKNGILSLTVANNGIKFTSIELENAFELFKNGNTNNNTPDNGLKLGLYSIKTAVNKLNGLVEIKTNTNDMTEIKVLIPDFYITKEIDTLLNTAVEYVI